MVINGIDTKDITFVIQGAVDKVNTKLCIESIRKYFDGAAIILSTWEKTNVKGLDADEFVFSKDPGTAVYDSSGNCNNINRQLKSSYEGLKRVKTKYAAKVRSDLIFDGYDFLRYFDTFPKYNEKYKKVKSRMIALSLYSRIASDFFFRAVINNYHISDWFLFGYTEDVLGYYSAAVIIDIKEYSRYYLEKRDYKSQLPYPLFFSKNSPEQYICSTYYGLNAEKETILSLSKSEQQKDSLLFLVNNFIILNYEYSKIYNGKWVDISRNEWSFPFSAVTLFFYGDFLRYYKRYCDKKFIIPDDIDKKIMKRKLSVLKDILWRNHLRNYRRMVWEKIKHKLRFVKKVMRTILPAYRVADATRDILLNLKNEENDRFNYLVYRANCLEEQNKKQSQQIKSLKKQIRAVTNTENDKDK